MSDPRQLIRENVTFKGLSIGKTTARLGVSIDRGSIDLIDADQILTNARLDADIRVVEEQQNMLPEAEPHLNAVADSKSLSVNHEAISFGLTFGRKDVNEAELGRFVAKVGTINLIRTGDAGGEDAEHAEEQEPDDDDLTPELYQDDAEPQEAAQTPKEPEPTPEPSKPKEAADAPQQAATATATVPPGISLDDLLITPKAQEALIVAGMRTAWDIVEHLNEGVRLDRLPGIGAMKAQKIEDAAREAVKRNPKPKPSQIAAQQSAEENDRRPAWARTRLDDPQFKLSPETVKHLANNGLETLGGLVGFLERGNELESDLDLGEQEFAREMIVSNIENRLRVWKENHPEAAAEIDERINASQSVMQ